MKAPLNTTSNERWLVALEVEKTWNRKREDIEARISERRQTWTKLLDSLNGEITFDSSMRILDIGAETTSIFLALRDGEKYAVDPLFAYLFDLHPFLKEIEEYKDVTFINSPVETMPPDSSFDIIFSLAAFDHIGKLGHLVDKIDELLTPSGYLVIMVDCHADPIVRNIMNFFDVELYHPHHFITEDIIRLLPSYKLKNQKQIFEIYDDCPSTGQRTQLEIYRVDKLIARMWQLLGDWGKRGDILFALKFVLCYGLAFSVSLLRRKDRPIHPLKKPNLFVFQKQ